MAVFCGSASGRDPVYRDAAKQFGRTLALQGIGLVYGGGHVGLMGADAVLACGGEAISVMPQALVDREIAHQGLTCLEVAPDMHVRKNRMSDLSDAFVALPGGVGTLEEIFEQWTWGNLGIHEKLSGFLNVNSYLSPILSMINGIIDQIFMREYYGRMLVVSDDISTMLSMFAHYIPPARKWSERQSA